MIAIDKAVDPAWVEHVCTKDECGHVCWLDNDIPTKSVSMYFGDAGSMDGEGPCDCEGHNMAAGHEHWDDR